ncbi:MAG: rod shape-determining protein MreC [Planctomycetota bacterium]|nr:rod shape-determining protein MreC [Planctomycetota bacterium]
MRKRIERWMPLIFGSIALMLMLVPASAVNDAKAATYALAMPLLSSNVPRERIAAAEDIGKLPKPDRELLLKFDAKLTAKEEEVRQLRAQMEEIRAARACGAPEAALAGAIPAQVIGRRMLWGEEYLAVDRGRSDGVENGAGVLHAGMVVGRVVGTSERAAVFAFITHKGVQVPARLLNGRGNGMLIGSRIAGEPGCRLEFVRDRVEVTVGDAVVTSGLDGTFPAGLPIGKVVERSLPAGTRFWDIRVEPKTSPDDLETVLILRPDAAALPWPGRKTGGTRQHER